MFCLGMLFVMIIPLSTMFTAIFFSLKYFIEKYNTIYVYQKEFEARGRLRKQILPISIASVMFVQFINFTFMGFYHKIEFFILGLISMVFQMGLLVYYYIKYIKNKEHKNIQQKKEFNQIVEDN
jgi:hypothetical protein